MSAAGLFDAPGTKRQKRPWLNWLLTGNSVAEGEIPTFSLTNGETNPEMDSDFLKDKLWRWTVELLWTVVPSCWLNELKIFTTTTLLPVELKSFLHSSMNNSLRSSIEMLLDTFPAISAALPLKKCNMALYAGTSLCLTGIVPYIWSWAKKGEITFLQLQLDGTTCFQWCHSNVLYFFSLLCVIWKKANLYKIWPNGLKTFFTKSCIVSNSEQVLLITFL